MRKKPTKRQRQRANKKRRENREKIAQQKYKERINTINLKLEDYFNQFGNSGYEYDNIANSMVKFFEKNFGFLMEYGSDTKPMSIYPGAYTIKDNSKNLRTKITKAYKYMAEQEHASVLAEKLYGTTNPNVTKSMSTVRKLVNDVSPNYYKALSVLTHKEQMPFKSKFSEELKGKSRYSDEFKESYEKLGKEIIDFIDRKSKMEEKILDNLTKDDVGEPTTIADLLNKLKK